MLPQIIICAIGFFCTVNSCGLGPCGPSGSGGSPGGYGGSAGGYGGSAGGQGGSTGGYGGGIGGFGGGMSGIGGYGGNMGGYGSGAEMSKPKPYNFNYQANGMGSNSFRNEQADASGNVQGSYGYTDSQGLYRQVQYTAGAGGFRATVKTNEPGTDSKPESPADVNMIAEPAPAGIQEKYTRRAGIGGYGGVGGGMGGVGGGMGGYGGVGGGFGGSGGIGGGMGGYGSSGMGGLAGGMSRHGGMGGIGGGMGVYGGIGGLGGGSSGSFAGIGRSGSGKSIH